MQFLLTPDLSYFVDPRPSTSCTGSPRGGLIAPIVLVWGERHAPTWTYQVTWVFSLAWMAVTMLINVVTGSNYGYLNAHPRALRFDAMGPWPTYLGVGCGILAVTWAGMTWPWETPQAPVSVVAAPDMAKRRERSATLPCLPALHRTVGAYLFQLA